MSESAAAWPFEGLPQLPKAAPGRQPVPDLAACMALWDKYQMLPNIRAHSRMVATIAQALAARAAQRGFDVNVDAVYAAGLLHDIAKTWCIRHGGSHDLLGASWVTQETGNHSIAQGVILHVHWPWALPRGGAICQLPIFVLYADKRCMHARCVSLRERLDDLLNRYGKTEKSRTMIREGMRQARNMELELSEQLGWDLHEYSFDCGRLVQ